MTQCRGVTVGVARICAEGDNTSGRGEGDDEVLTVDLGEVHPRIDTIVFPVSSYQGHSLEWVSNAHCRLVDDRDVELARFTLTLGVPETGLAMAKTSATATSGSSGPSARASRSRCRPSR